MKKILFLFLLFFCDLAIYDPLAAAQDIHISYSPPFVPIVNNVPFSAWSGGATQVFIFAVTPQAALNAYMTNSGGAGHAITATFFATGSQNVPDFTNNQAQWSAFAVVNPVTGTSSNVQAITIGATSTSNLVSGITSAAQIAVKLSGAPASADAFTMNFTLTPNGITGLSVVVGPKLANGPSSCPACSPVLIAGQDLSSNIVVPTVFGSSSGAGFVIGDTALTVGGILQTSNNKVFGPGGGSANGALVVNQVSQATLANHITTATTTTVCASRCELIEVIIGTGVAAATVTVQCPSLTTVSVLAAAVLTQPFVVPFRLNCATVSIITNQATDVTAIFQN